MELQALLVLCGVGVAGVAVLLLMGLFSTSGTSYEEAIAQQRKAATELLALAVNKNKPKKNNKKAIKKQAKKEKKENAAAATGSEQESEAPAESGVEDDPTPAPVKAHVEFCPPVVVDVPRDTPPNVKIRKRGKDPKVKPILLNKEDPSCVSDPTSVPATSTLANHFEEMHPKDEFELLQSTLAAEKSQEKVEEVVEKKEAKAPKPVKAKNQAPKVTPPVEVAKEEAPRERHNSGDAPKEQRKVNKKPEKKPEKPVEEVIEVREEVVPPLNVPQPSELTTDKLLKQALVTPPAAAPVAATSTPPGGKKKKKPEPNVLSLMAGDSGGVNIGELVRVVREAALSRNEIQILTDALLNKHHDTLPEHSEWTEGPNDPMQKLKKQLADKEKALGDEIEASQALHAKLKELRNTLNAERRTATNSARAAEAAAAAARAELHTLQARLQRLLDDNHAIAQEKLMAESALLSQVSGLQGECQAQALEAAQARLDAAQARDATIMAQQHAADMAQQLQEATCTCTELENQRQMAVHAEQLAQQELRQAQERLLAMTELQNEVQRLSSLVQAAEASAETAKEEAEKEKQQLLSDIASLREQLAAAESELAEVKQMKAAPAQNGLPTNDQHKAAELAKVESVVESLRSELDAAQKCSREQREQLADLTRQLHTYQDKNNETLTKAQEAQYNEVVSVLRAVCPSAAPSNAAGKEWLQTFADNLKKELEKRDNEKKELEKRQAEKELEKREIEKKLTAQVEQSAPPSDDRVNELQAQNEQLQSLVDKYKRIIDDTEGVLSRLQQNVTTEEARWSQQLADKQRELDDLRHTTVQQLQNKIDSLETELAQARTNNHNHSFADAERMTEERLMGGLSDKQNLDVCNGPSQVGLEK